MFDINSFNEYKIRRETLEAIAEKLREMVGKTSKLTTEEIIYWLGRVKFMPQGHAINTEEDFRLGDFSSNSIGTIPNIVKTSGEDQSFSFNFDNSIATGLIVDLPTVPEVDTVQNISLWEQNRPAANAYSSWTYDIDTTINIGLYNGGADFEVIAIPIRLEANKKYIFSMEYYCPTTLTGDYDDPYAPFIGFLPYQALVLNSNPYDNAYAYTVMDLQVLDYTLYSCEFTPTENLNGCIGFVTGSIRDNVATEFRIKNITLEIIDQEV